MPKNLKISIDPHWLHFIQSMFFKLGVTSTHIRSLKDLLFVFFCWKIQDHETHGPYQSTWFFNELVIEKESDHFLGLADKLEATLL